MLITDFYRSKLANGSRQNGPEDLAARTRDVTYWYIDFREFANVVKYRLAMMRKGIDEQISKVSASKTPGDPAEGRRK